MTPRPYRIDVPDAVLDDLRARLERTRWPEPLPGTPWDDGANLAYVKELCDYWRTATTGERRKPPSTPTRSS